MLTNPQMPLPNVSNAGTTAIFFTASFLVGIGMHDRDIDCPWLNDTRSETISPPKSLKNEIGAPSRVSGGVTARDRLTPQPGPSRGSARRKRDLSRSVREHKLIVPVNQTPLTRRRKPDA